MKNLNIYQIIKENHLSEKATQIGISNQYIFLVDKISTKKQIKEIIEKMFKVHVVNVNTCLQNGKNKSFGRIQGKRKSFKKAFIRLADNESIDLINEIK